MLTYEEITLEFIKLNIITNTNEINKRAQYILTKYPTLYNELIQCTSFLPLESTCRARIYCIRNNIRAQPTCKSCGKAMTFNPAKGIFNVYCSNTTGNSCAATDTELMARRQATIEHKYGVKNPAHSAELQRKRVNTNLNKYGTIAPAMNEAIRDKIKATLLERYGTSSISNIEGVTQRRRDTNIDRYGAPTYAQSLIPPTTIEQLENVQWLTEQLKDFTLSEIALSLNTSVYTVRKYVYQSNLQSNIINSGSAEQREIAKFLDQLGITYTINDRQAISPRELDFFIPSLNLAIEYNGIYFHSELSQRDKRYHINKTLSCNNNNIRLIQIWSNEWATKQDIVKSRIKHAVRKSQPIYARKCTIEVLNAANARAFFEDNHIQGHATATICYALMYNGKCVAAMSFISARFSKEYQWELLRYSSVKDYSVVGGASKLFQHFISVHAPRSIVSYCDLRWGTGNLYTALGFTYSHRSVSNYFYFVRNGNTNVLHSRVQFQKHKLASKLETFDPNLTEWDNMKNNGYDRIWDCGNAVYSWISPIQTEE